MRKGDNELRRMISASFEQHLNPCLTFEEYVVGTSNQFAFSAAQAVAKDPEAADYNPLFLYSEWPVGKTHLLHAIGNAINAKSPKTCVRLTDKMSFAGELCNAIRLNGLTEMREQLNDVDTLLFDDFSFAMSEVWLAEAFFLLVCDLLDDGKRVVVTANFADCLQRFAGSFRRRFENTLFADFHSLNLESKIAILKYDASEFGVTLTDEVSLYLSENLKRRCDLNGCVKWLIVRSKFAGSKIDLSLAEKYVGSVNSSG